jgi:hypothetical protein
VKVLGVLYLVFSGLMLCAAVFLLLALGAASGIVGTTAEPHDAAVALPIIGIAGTALVAFLVVMALPGLLAGIGLLKYRNWGRILTIVLSVLHLLNFPIGTALGIYGLWVLFNKETEALFSSPVVIGPA